MEINYNKKTAKYLGSVKSIKKHFGELSKIIVEKIGMMAKVTNINERLKLPGHVHELVYQAKGVFSVTLKHPFRLVFRYYAHTQTIEILAIDDYHGKAKKLQTTIILIKYIKQCRNKNLM